MVVHRLAVHVERLDVAVVVDRLELDVGHADLFALVDIRRALQHVQELRNQGIACELFHEPVKMDKQFKYAEKKFIPYVVIIGTKEIETGEAVVKNLSTSEQQKIPLIRLTDFFKQINQ